MPRLPWRSAQSSTGSIGRQAVFRRASPSQALLVRHTSSLTRSRHGNNRESLGSPWSLLPRHRFGTSLFNVPVLLLLRLFYQAASINLNGVPDDHGQFHAGAGQLLADAAHMQQRKSTSMSQPPNKDAIERLFGSDEQMSTKDWVHRLTESRSTCENLHITSITWVKALASPLSHEYIQFIVEDVVTGTRSRVLADRHEDGDWVFLGWKERPYNRHDLPLPLMSLTYRDPHTRPSLLDMAKLLADVTARRPYSILREMCWWYAEAVFDTAHTAFGGRLEEWKWASYRYSFIVRASVLRRAELTADAEDFQKQNMQDMSY